MPRTFAILSLFFFLAFFLSASVYSLPNESCSPLIEKLEQKTQKSEKQSPTQNRTQPLLASELFKANLSFLDHSTIASLPQAIRSSLAARVRTSDNRLDSSLIHRLFLRADTPVARSQTKERLEWLNHSVTNIEQMNDHDFSEFLGHQLFKNRFHETVTHSDFSSSDPLIQQKAWDELLLMDRSEKERLLAQILNNSPDAAVRTRARRAFTALGLKLEVTPEILSDIKNELASQHNEISGALEFELQHLSDEQLLSLNIKLPQNRSSLIERALALVRWRKLETQVEFLRQTGVPENEISAYKAQYENLLSQSINALTSEHAQDSVVRNRVIDNLKMTPFKTPETREILVRLIENDSNSQISYEAALEVLTSAQQATRLLNNSDTKVQTAASHSLANNFRAAVSAEPPKNDSNSYFAGLSAHRPMDKRWYDIGAIGKEGQTARGVDAFRFSQHVYQLPEAAVDKINVKDSVATFVAQAKDWHNSIPSGWQANQTVIDPKTGLKAAVYMTPNPDGPPSKVYAFGGTETKNDVMADMALGKTQIESPHFRRLIDSAAEDIINGGNILITGHSLGGGLSQAFSYYVCKRAHELRKIQERQLEHTDPPAYGKISVVTWQAFGAEDVVKADPNYSPLQFSEVPGLNKAHGPTIASGERIPLRIENYRLKGDPIPLIGKFLGPVFDIGGADPQFKSSSFPSLSKHFLNNSNEPAFIQNGLETATPSRRMQLPHTLVSIFSRTVGSLAERQINKDFLKHWQASLDFLLKARESWETSEDYKEETPDWKSSLMGKGLGYIPTIPFLHREIDTLVSELPFMPFSLRETANDMIAATQERIDNIRRERRKKPQLLHMPATSAKK